VLVSLERSLAFDAKNVKVDQVLSLESQIKKLSRRLARPTFSDAIRRDLWNRDQRTCYLCTLEITHWNGDSMHIDHVRPRSQGGSDEPHNLRIAQPVCNLRKGDRQLADKRMKAILAELRKTEMDDLKNSLF
jgi:5-methylcytosine-specific restriction endonuclease McrA